MNRVKRSDVKNVEQSLWVAADAVLKHFESVKVLKSKEDDSPLTQADLDSNDIILSALHSFDASIPVITEESKSLPYVKRKHWEAFWIVDPLDGTKEFIAGLPEFTINLAYVQKRIPVLGFVLCPLTGVLYIGERGSGSLKCMRSGDAQRIYSNNKTKNRIAVTSRFHAKPYEKEFLEKHSISSVITLGSSLKLTALAEGLADVYPRQTPIHEWDVAAGDAVFRYSGREKENIVNYLYNTEILTFSDFLIGL